KLVEGCPTCPERTQSRSDACDIARAKHAVRHSQLPTSDSRTSMPHTPDSHTIGRPFSAAAVIHKTRCERLKQNEKRETSNEKRLSGCHYSQDDRQRLKQNEK